MQRKLPRAFNTGNARAFAIKLSELQKWSETLEKLKNHTDKQDVTHISDLSDRSGLVAA